VLLKICLSENYLHVAREPGLWRCVKVSTNETGNFQRTFHVSSFMKLSHLCKTFEMTISLIRCVTHFSSHDSYQFYSFFKLF